MPFLFVQKRNHSESKDVIKVNRLSSLLGTETLFH